MEQIWVFLRSVWLGKPKCTETDLKKSQICPIWGQSDPIRMPHLTSLTEYKLNPSHVKQGQSVYWTDSSAEPADQATSYITHRGVSSVGARESRNYLSIDNLKLEI